MKKVCVFCGSSPGARTEYAAAAEQAGRELAERGIGLVYGGGGVGMMEIIAQTVLDGGGEVVGVIPAALMEKEVAFKGLPDLRVVNSMHERKAMMADLADGFIALPGGLGTIEEFLEVVTWAQLGIHTKPCGVLNVCGYFDDLIGFLDKAVAENFMKEEHRCLVLVHERPKELLDRMESYQPPDIDKVGWILSVNNT